MTLQAGVEARSPAQTLVGLLVSFPGDFGPFPIMEHQVWLSQAIRWVLIALYLKLVEHSWKASLAVDIWSETRRMKKSLKQAVVYG